MTVKDMLPKPGFFTERLWIFFTGLAFSAVVGLFLMVWAPIRDHARTFWAMPSELAAMRTQIADLAEGVKRATGEDRVIRQTPGLSYVAEPVYQGERVVLFMVAQRTTLGRDCRLMEWSALFTDANGIAVPGSPVYPGGPRRQISDTATRLRIELNPPETLQPGRIELFLALTYDCAGRQVYDRTDPVIYGMLPGPRP